MDLETKLLSRRKIRKGCWEYTGCKDKDGYGVLSYKGKSIRLNRLAAHIWLEFNLKSKLYVCHRCDNPKCFNPDHLFIATNQENTEDRVKKGRSSKGEKVPTGKLTTKQVLEIRKLLKSKAKRVDIASRYGITYVSLWRISTGESWGHIQ